MKTSVANIDRSIEQKRKNLFFPEGIIGFEEYKDYSIKKDKSKEPFYWLESDNNPEVSFIVIDPEEFYPNYKVILSDADKLALETDDIEQCQVLSIVSVPQGSDKITANLLAPILINKETKAGKQIILQDEDYSVQHLILEEMIKNTEEKNVSTFTQTK
ncbi:MAG: flagellar assembly protein FliW [Candidatus Omnitrophota bacterium]